MATHNDTGILAPVEDFCPQPRPTVSDEWRELIEQQKKYIAQLLASIDKLTEENNKLKTENRLLRMRNGQQRYDLCDAVWALCARFFDSKRETTIRLEIVENQEAWWYLQYDVLCIRSGHLKDFLTFLKKHMNQQHQKQLLTKDNVKARNYIRDYLIQHLRIYASGQVKKFDADSLRHPLLQVFTSVKP